MASGELSWGLCMTCNSNSVCTRREGIKLPVLFCEEFDDSTVEILERPSLLSMADENDVLDRTMGLCYNCESRDSCTLQSSPGGVWHCEEYR